MGISSLTCLNGIRLLCFSGATEEELPRVPDSPASIELRFCYHG